MPYGSKSDLILRYGELEIIQRTDRENVGVIDDSVLTAAQASADADINRYLRVKGYPADGSLVSDDLKNLALPMVRFYLYENMNIPDEVQQAYDRQINTLKDFVKGFVDFDFVAEKTEQQSAGDVAVIAGASTFTNDILRGY